MRVALLAFIAILSLTQAQRTPKPPPPPPGVGSESGSGSKRPGITFGTNNRESSIQTQGFSPFTSKWVYCNGSWKLVK